MCAISLLIISYQFILPKIQLNIFFSVQKKNFLEFNITCNNNRITQFRTVEYLGCCLSAKPNGEYVTVKLFKKIKKTNTKLHFL